MSVIYGYSSCLYHDISIIISICEINLEIFYFIFRPFGSKKIVKNKVILKKNPRTYIFLLRHFKHPIIVAI